MRKKILKIGIYFICLSVFSFSNVLSFATPYEDIYPTTALMDLIAVEGRCRDRRTDVLEAWTVVDLIKTKWDAMKDANRKKTVANFLVEMMGSGFWATAGGLGGRTESELKSYYANLSLMDLYSDALENVKSEIDAFKLGVPIYNSAHKHATKIVKSHKTNHHDETNMNLHNVPAFITWKCRDTLPTFSCRDNHTAGKAVCEVLYLTPRGAFYTHRELCGEEVDEHGFKTPISGDGIFYYTCDPIANDKHKVRSCTRDFTDGSGVTTTCGDGFRRCVGHKKDHNWDNLINWETKHNDKKKISSDEDIADNDDSNPGTPPADVAYTCGIHSGPAESESSDHSTTISGWSGSFYECQPHTTFSCGHTDPTANAAYHAPKTCTQTNTQGDSCVATGLYECKSSHTCVYSCGHSGCTQTVSSSTQHSATCASGHSYWSCKSSDVSLHRTRTCRLSTCGKSWERCSTPGGTPLCDDPWRRSHGLPCWKKE